MKSSLEKISHSNTRIWRGTKALIGAGLILMASACGIDKDYRDTTNLYFSESLLSGGRPLNDGEMAVALRICYAFRSKRTKFLAEMLQSEFDFTYQTKDCNNQVSSPVELKTTLKQLMVDGPMSYEAEGVNFSYMRELQTDINGEMAELCTQIFKGETPLNVVEKDNQFFEYAFLSNVYDTVEIRVGSQETPQDQAATVMRMNRYEVLTNQQSSGDYLGLVVRGSRYFPCDGDNTKVRSQEQTFIAP